MKSDGISAPLAVPIPAPSTRRNELALIALTGFGQVALVAWNTYNISHGLAVSSMVVGFLISIVWTLNVRSIALGGWTERILYSVSAAAGTVAGMAIPHLINLL